MGSANRFPWKSRSFPSCSSKPGTSEELAQSCLARQYLPLLRIRPVTLFGARREFYPLVRLVWTRGGCLPL